MSLWLFIWRLNPPHLWHINIIKRALKENKKVLILLWTNLIYSKNNPLDFNVRKNILKKIFTEKNIIFLEIQDKKTDLEWIENIKNIINSIDDFSSFNQINLYWWDFENDSAFKVFKEYEENFTNCTFNYILNSRKNSFIEYEWKKYLISSTNLREALHNKNYDFAKKICNEKIFEDIKREFIFIRWKNI